MTETYEDLLQRVWDEGTKRPDRTNTGTISLFGGRIRYNLKEGFPLITSKKVHFHSIVTELAWMLSGETNVKYLQDRGVTIWNEWANEHDEPHPAASLDKRAGDLGPVYGAQWRAWPDANVEEARWRGCTIDQIAGVLDSLEHDPFSRRHVVSAWNVGELHSMNLVPCHLLFQFYVREDEDGVRHLSIQVYQRSADMFLGVPFNIASYALLTHLVAHHLGYEVDELIWIGGDCHIYSNHIVQVAQQLKWHREAPIELPDLKILGGRVFDENADLTPEEFDIELHRYSPRPALRAPVAV